MPRTGGIFSLIASYFAVDGATITTDQHNPVLEDIAQALTDSLPRNGTAAMTGNLPMGAKKITGLAAGTAASDAVRKDQVQPVDATLTSIAALGTIAGRTIYTTGVDTWAETALTAFARTLLDDTTAAEARATLLLGENLLASSSSVTDANNVIDSGFWRTDGTALNIPEATIGVGFSAQYNSNGNLQIWASLVTGTLWWRKKNVAWSTWAEVTHSGNFAAMLRAAPYVSTAQTITSAGLLTLAHGFGAAPSGLACRLRCQTAEHGWAVNDEMAAELSPSGAPKVNSIWADATNVYVRFSNTASCFNGGNKSTGSAAELTNANWRLIVRAWP